MSNKFIYSLLIDTSSNRSIISLNRDDTSLSHSFILLDRELSSSLFPSIKLILEKNTITPEDLSFIAIGTGPGSYTGIRVGAAVAKSLSYAKSIPLIDFCSLKGFVPQETGRFFSLFDAKSGGIYLLEGEKSKKTVLYPQKPSLLPLNEALVHINKSSFLISPHMKELKEKLHSLSNTEKWIDGYPDPDHLAKLTFFKYKNSNFTLSDKLELLYLRGPKPIAL